MEKVASTDLLQIGKNVILSLCDLRKIYQIVSGWYLESISNQRFFDLIFLICNYEVSCICVCAYMHVCEEDYTLFSDKKPENPYLLHNFMSKGQ